MSRRTADLNPIEAAERQRAVILRLVRVSFLALVMTFVLLAILGFQAPGYTVANGLAINWWIPLGVGLLIFFFAIALDLFTPRKKLSTISAVFFGVIAGMLATVALSFIIDLLLKSWGSDSTIRELQPIVNSVKILLALSFCYLAVSTLIQTQEEFRLVIPYVEFAKQIRGTRPLLLDTSALIDGRAADIAQVNAFQAPLVIPRFVLEELQSLADSGDAMKRAKGRRGLDVVARLQRMPRLDLAIDDRAVQSKAVDQMLVEAAKVIPATVVTTDFALAKVCAIQGVQVLNINDLANAMRPPLIPGESVTLKLIRAGEQPGQGVGYLPDGTMVVAEDAGHAVGQTVTLTVQTALQTSAGRLIFARLQAGPEPAQPAPAPVPLPEPPIDEVRVAEPPLPRPERSPFPPNAPRTLRGGTPRNPRR